MTGRYAVIGYKLKQNASEGCNSCASLAGLVLSFVACFILLVIAPLQHLFAVLQRQLYVDGFSKRPTHAGVTHACMQQAVRFIVTDGTLAAAAAVGLS